MPRSVAWLLRLPVIAAAIWAAWFHVYLPFTCNRLLLSIRGTTDRLQKMGRLAAEATGSENARRLEAAAITSRSDVNVPLLLAYNAHVMGDREATLRQIENALAIQPRPEIYIFRAESRLEVGDLDGAIEDLKVAARFDRLNLWRVDEELRKRVAEELNLDLDHDPILEESIKRRQRNRRGRSRR